MKFRVWFSIFLGTHIPYCVQLFVLDTLLNCMSPYLGSYHYSFSFHYCFQFKFLQVRIKFKWYLKDKSFWFRLFVAKIWTLGNALLVTFTLMHFQKNSNVNSIPLKNLSYHWSCTLKNRYKFPSSIWRIPCLVKEFKSAFRGNKPLRRLTYDRALCPYEQAVFFQMMS